MPEQEGTGAGFSTEISSSFVTADAKLFQDGGRSSQTAFRCIEMLMPLLQSSPLLW